jgi:glucuronate isomerase
MAFLDENYLLSNPTAFKILKEIINLPILDAHNHADVKEIARNANYNDIWFIEAATDHYVWEMMRKRAVPENFITGNASNKEKWLKLAEVFEDFVGNPTYEWIHLDLQRRLGITKLINKANAEAIWDEAQKILQDPAKKPLALLKEMRVEAMCSTDDPVDLLENHQQLAKNPDAPKILPTWRPDKAMNIFKPDFPQYIEKLSARVKKPINSVKDLVKALQETHDYFEQNGCKASDHGIHTPFGFKVPEERAEQAFQKRLKGLELSKEETSNYMSYLMHQFGEMNAKSKWVTQIHIGAVRDYRESLYTKLGPDVGGDLSDHLIEIVNPLKDFLNAFDGRLKIALYSLDPNHWPTLATLTRAFGHMVNLGAAWWFNDSPIGMKRQLEYILSIDLLMNFVGMVTDSRKLMSYGSRTEMFRRVLADVLGNMVEKGQVPEELAIRVAKFMCYEGPKQFFGF